MRRLAGGHFRARLTEGLLDTLEPADRDQLVFDDQLATFGFRLTPEGMGVFFIGKPRRTVGYRPALSVDQARERWWPACNHNRSRQSETAPRLGELESRLHFVDRTRSVAACAKVDYISSIALAQSRLARNGREPDARANADRRH
jgi:hypothetical protein